MHIWRMDFQDYFLVLVSSKSCIQHQQENVGVIGDPATAMRDPIFYRWHSFIDEIFQEHKKTLPRYTENQVNISKNI